jgi:HAMP domain-containing protein
MSLDGLRAWIGEVERKLRMRTRVFLVLLAIAIGGAGAGIYLAIEADNGASSDEVKALEEKVEATGGAGVTVTPMQTQINQLHSEIESLRSAAAAQEAAKEPVETAKPPKKEPQEAEAEK